MIRKQTVDILSTLGRHFPIISLYFLRTLSTFFFIWGSESKLSTFCRHSVDIFLSFLCIFCGHCQHFFFICARKANCRHFVDTRSTFSYHFFVFSADTVNIFFSLGLRKQTVDILSTLGRHFPIISLYFLRTLSTFFFHLGSESKLSTFCRHSVDIFLSFLCIFCGHCQHFFSFVLGKQTVDILSTLGRHFPYHFFVFSADTDNIFFHLCSESKLSTFCRHSVDIFPIISLYFLRTLTIFFSFVLGKANCRHFVDTRSTFSYHFFVFSADTVNIFFHLCSESKLSTFCRHSVDIFPIISLYFLRTLTIFFFICARKANCRHFVDTRSTFSYHFFVFSADTVNIFFHLCSESKLSTFCRHSVDIFLSFLCIFCGHCQHFFSFVLGKANCRHFVDTRSTFSYHFFVFSADTVNIFFSFVLGKQTVDILSTLGRHFPYHFFVFSADTDNIFFHLCSESKLSTFCRHSVDIFPIISLYFLRTLTSIFFH